MRPVELDPSRMPPSEFNKYQHGAVQAYGVSQSAVDYILSQRYGQEHFGGMPGGPEGFGMVGAATASVEPTRAISGCFGPGSQIPSLLELRYRGF